MNARMILPPLMGAMLIGCEGVIVASGPPRRAVIVAEPAPVVVAPDPPAPEPVVVAPAPTYVEEGAVVGGVVVVAPPEVDGYILIGGEWYYWHPGVRCWVHAHRAVGWHPGPSIRIYRGWHEHPMYRQHQQHHR